MPTTTSTATITATRSATTPVARPPTSRSRLTAQRGAAIGSAAASIGRTAWFGILVVAICFEGLGRKFLETVPGALFYFAKDGVLLLGLIIFGVQRNVQAAAAYLFRGFAPVLPIAVLWTVGQMANPEAPGLELTVLGLRAYWVWWLAPLVIATALRGERVRHGALMAFGVSTILIAGLALVQFSLPAGHVLNRYASTGPEMSIALVASSGRARVTSTFSYITGFTDFSVIVPALLLSVGLATTSRTLKGTAFAGTVLTGLALPASGSRGPVLMAIAALALVAYATGLFWTRQGRRVMALGGIAIAAAMLLSTAAVEGLQSRFRDDPEETRGRFVEALALVPPFAMLFIEYPTLGIGTGSQQNAASVMSPHRRYVTEGEPGRVLLELGIPGYFLVSFVRVGLLIALVRAGVLLKRKGMRAEAGAAWALALLTLTQNLIFDHIAQALFFVGAGIVLESVVRACAAKPQATP